MGRRGIARGGEGGRLLVHRCCDCGGLPLFELIDLFDVALRRLRAKMANAHVLREFLHEGNLIGEDRKNGPKRTWKARRNTIGDRPKNCKTS